MTNDNSRRTSDFYIPVDIDKRYEYSVTVKSNNNNTAVYMGFEPYDIDRNRMTANNYKYISNTLTTLAKDLKNGDTYVYLTDMTNWNVTTTSSYNHGFIFWDYVDSTGYHYPELTYSRNVWANLYDNNTSEITDNIEINKAIDGEVVNRIKLKKAWSVGTIPAGTKLSQCNDGLQYPYSLVGNGKLSLDWSTKSAIIQGIGNSGDNKMFRHGQKYFRFMVMPNYSALPNVTTYYKDFYLREITD